MKRTILGMIVIILSFLNARPGVAKIYSQETQTKSETAETPELQEAHRLSRQVVDLVALKKYDEALPLAKRALEIREKSLGREHPSVGQALENLAYIYQQKGKYMEAESLYKRRLSIDEKTFGKDSINLTNTLTQLGTVSYAVGDNARARESFERALAITEKARGPSDLQTALALINLGQLYERMAQYDKALVCYRRALDIKQQKLGAEHKEVLALLGNCACALRLDGKTEEAEEYDKRSRVGMNSAIGNWVSGHVLQGTAIKRVQPDYPVEAKRARLAGRVVVEVTVDEAGKVIAARATCGPGLLIGAALAAARQWTFTQTTLGGKTLKVIGTITFNFTL